MTNYYRRVGYKIPTQEINVGGTIQVSRGSPPQPLIITANTAPSPARSAAALLDIVGPDGAVPLVQIDAFGTGIDSVLRQTAARGTATTPTAIQSGDFIGEWDLRGMMDNGLYSRGSGLNVLAIENFTSTATGTKLQLTVIGQGGTAAISPLTVTGVAGTGIATTLVPASTSYANDAAAAAGGVPVGGVYRNGSVLQCRIS